MALTKKDLLKTAQDVEEVEIEALDGEKVKIRRLRDGEYNEIQNLTMDSLDIKNKLSQKDIMKLKETENKEDQVDILNTLGVNVDIKKINKIDKQSNYLACVYGLSVDGESWTEEEVKELPVGVPQEIADKVFEITNANVSEEELEPFRGE